MEENKKPSNPNAFPAEFDPHIHASNKGITQKEMLEISNGMTLRDYFAAKAMQGLIYKSEPSKGSTNIHPEWISENSYKIADEMLKQRELNQD